MGKGGVTLEVFDEDFGNLEEFLGQVIGRSCISGLNILALSHFDVVADTCEHEPLHHSCITCT